MSSLRSPLALGLLLQLSTLAPAATGQDLPEPALWLQEYLRLDTTNPPGHEYRGAGLLIRILRQEGIPARVLVTPEGRTSVFAHLPAVGPPARDGLLLMHHIDVVPPGSGWRHEPFSGDLQDGFLWGRGAVDVKSLGIAQLSALVELKRSGAPRRRDLYLLAVADEESGGGRGTGWLLEQHPELFEDVAAVLNEGGSNRAGQRGVLWWGVEVSQKRPLWLQVSARGRAGHASGLNPSSAAHELIVALARLLERPPQYRVTEGVRTYLRAVAPLHNPGRAEILRNIDEAISPQGPTKPLMPGMGGLFLDTVQVTMLEASDRINTVSPSATGFLDVRLLPDTDAESFLEEVRRALGDEVEVEVLLSEPPGTPSPLDTEIYRLLESALAGEAPVVPTFISGFTDSRYFRRRGIPAYGFSPFVLSHEELRGIHNVDERISVEAFMEGVRRTVQIVAKYASGNN